MESALKLQPVEKPVVAVFQDADLVSLQLTSLVRDADCNVFEIFPHSDISEMANAAPDPPQLAVVGLGGETPAAERIAQVRGLPSFADVPILAIARAGVRVPNRSELEPLGVTGLVTHNADREHLVFRIGQLARDLSERRRYQRVNCLLPVEIEARGARSQEVVLSLSVAGAGVASGRELDQNMDVRVKFLSGPLSIAGSIDGRVARISESANSVPKFRVGVVFYGLAPGVRSALVAVIESLWESRQP